MQKMGCKRWMQRWVVTRTENSKLSSTEKIPWLCLFSILHP
ncbi:unnamed protein product [Ixodes pacificus]